MQRRVIKLAQSVEKIKKYEQKGRWGVRASVTLGGAGVVLRLFKSANASSMLHESGHVFLGQVIEDVDVIATYIFTSASRNDAKGKYTLRVNWEDKNKKPVNMILTRGWESQFGGDRYIKLDD